MGHKWTDAIRLNGKKRWNGETVEFTLAEVSFVNQKCGDWWIEQGGGAYVIDPATIRLADDPRKHPTFTTTCPNCVDPKDPRKAMLEEIRERVDKFRYWTNYNHYQMVHFLISRTLVEMLLDEMEAKL